MAPPIPPINGETRALPPPLEEVPMDLPEEATPLTAPESQKSQCLDTVFFAGDEQYHSIPYIWGLFRSQAVNSEAPGHRLPGSNGGVFAGHEAIIRQNYKSYIPKECRAEHYKGMISTGDKTDIATIEEFNSYMRTLGRLQKNNPMHRIWVHLVGNHEILHSGTARSGTDFFGVLGWFLKLEGERTYKKDIQSPETGGEENILNKEKLIALINHHFFGATLKIVIVDETNPSHYKLAANTDKLLEWKDYKSVYNNFWKTQDADNWQAVVRYRPHGHAISKDSEAEWIYMPAVKMGEYDTTRGTLPLYMIGLDTMDYTSHRSALGAIQGHLSPLQIKIVKSFIEQKKKENPNAKFILAGHYPASSIEEVRYSGLSKLLEDESIVAVVGAHHHRRNFIDLSDKKYQEELGFTRKQPLPEITVPAIMDGPNEITGMKYGVVNDELVLQFDFLGLDKEKIPGMDSEVKKAFDDIIPQLLSYRDAIQHITDARIREFAMQGTTTWRKVYLLLHPDSGLIADSGRLHDHMIAQDVIPTMIEDAQLYLRIAENATYLTLTEAGLKAEALGLRNAFYAHQKELDDYYERIFKGQYTNLVEHSAFHKIDEKSDVVNLATYKVLEAIKQKLDTDPTTTIKQKELLGKINHIVADLRRFQDAYKFWLQRYENLKKSDRDDVDYVFSADIFSSGYFRSIQQHIETLPYGSKAHAFMTLVFKESARQRDQFYQKLPNKKVPDHIEIRFSGETGKLSVQPGGAATFTDAEWKENQKNLGHAPGMDPATNPPEVFGDPKPEEHWVLRAGGSFYQGNESFVADFGGRWHLLEGAYAPRLSVELVAGFKTAGINGPEVPLKFAFNIGDPLGLIDVGPLVSSGLAFDGRNTSPFMGIGGQANIREGMLGFNFQHKWYHESGSNWTPNWEMTFNTDIMTWLRSLDVLQPGF